MPQVEKAPGRSVEMIAMERLGLRPDYRDVARLSDAATFTVKHLTFSGLRSLQADLGVTRDDFLRMLAVSPSTLDRGSRGRGKIKPALAERALRIARIHALAAVMFGEKPAREWLASQQGGLSGRVPNDMIASEFGAREVENLLHQIEYGVYV